MEGFFKLNRATILWTCCHNTPGQDLSRRGRAEGHLSLEVRWYILYDRLTVLELQLVTVSVWSFVKIYIHTALPSVYSSAFHLWGQREWPVVLWLLPCNAVVHARFVTLNIVCVQCSMTLNIVQHIGLGMHYQGS